MTNNGETGDMMTARLQLQCNLVDDTQTAFVTFAHQSNPGQLRSDDDMQVMQFTQPQSCIDPGTVPIDTCL